VVINGSSGEIICVCVDKGSTHDFKLYKESKVHMLPEIVTQADSGYQGIKELHANSELPMKSSKKHPLTKEQKKGNHNLSRSRVLIENVNRVLKVFRILSERYRNRRKKFGLRLNLIAGICNLNLSTLDCTLNI
jgi:hypothetical protein